MTLRLTTITFIIFLSLLLAYDYFPVLKKDDRNTSTCIHKYFLQGFVGYLTT